MPPRSRTALPAPARPRALGVAALLTLLVACNSSPAPDPNAPRVALVNPDGVPLAAGSSVRLTFSRIQNNTGQFVVRERATLRVTNAGQSPLDVRAAAVDPAWTLDPAVALPQTVAPGESLDLGVRFVAGQDVAQGPRLYTGTLTLTTNDPSAPTVRVPLAGLWQAGSERNPTTNLPDEPTLEQIRQALGWAVNLNTAADAASPSGANFDAVVPYNQEGAVRPQGDEVLSAYWVAADPGAPVTARQVASWADQTKSATLAWYPKGNPGGASVVLTRAANSAQTLLPTAPGGGAPGPSGTFAPAGAFGLRVADSGGNREFSDATLNRQDYDNSFGCRNLCGQHLRFWPLTDAAGNRVPDAYFLAVDYLGINHDYQDEVYILRNVRPAPILLKAGQSNRAYTGTDGRVWLPDRATPPIGDADTYFTPVGAIDEPGQAYSGPISGTADPGLYRTYRGNTGSAPRTVDYGLPINNGTYQVKLYFVDQAHASAGQRVFDVYAQGNRVIQNLDIALEAGGRYAALVKTLPAVQVTGGQLNLSLRASVDYPAISAIEVVR